MTLKENIEPLLQELPNINSNVVIVDKQNLLNIAEVEKGVLIVYASWSGPSIASFSATMKFLNDYRYNGQIIVVDNDCMSPDFQIEKLNYFCQGWGEIFVIDKGGIKYKYTRNCFNKFRQDYNNLN